MASKGPFDINEPSLHRIDTGVKASDSVNVDNVVDVGNNILKGMFRQRVLEYVFKKKDQVVTLATKTSMQTKNKTVSIDPQLLFQRLVTAGSL